MVPGGRVLFAERRAGLNECHALRVMNEDSTGATDAPWQLPCLGDTRQSPERRVTSNVELVAAPGGALLVYVENSYHPWIRPITEDVPFDEGIYAVLIDAGGRRGSEIVRVTPEETTALANIERTATTGPTFLRLHASAASDGERAVVAWYDNRPDAPGFYARALRMRMH